MNSIPVTYSPKQRYAQAVLTGAMSKTAAYIAFINPTSANPSQAAYRLEQTQAMRKLMGQLQIEQQLTSSIKEKQLEILDRSLTLVNDLLRHTGKSTQEELATLRLVKALSSHMDTRDDNYSVMQPLIPVVKLDKSQAVVEG